MTLLDLKAFLDTVTDAFAAVLDFELTIINAQPIKRVSGTGKYRERNSDWRQTYSFLAMEQKKPLVVLDAGKDFSEIAAASPESYSIIVYPILLEEVVEGAIVLASFTEQQHQNFIRKKDDLLTYLEKTASLISAKLMQERLTDLQKKNARQLSIIFESIKDGLILYSQTAGVLQINGLAANLIKYQENQPANKILEEIISISRHVIDSNAPVSHEIVPQHDKNHHPLFIKVMPVEFACALCVITPFRSIQSTITQSGFEEPNVEIITKNSDMLEMKRQILMLGNSISNVLILGESGTGKELIARLLHHTSNRQKGPFVSVNCAAIPESLLESELFGYEEGAFTGAKKGGKIGKFMLANTGTLFLDEIGDMPLYMQAKLLRVLNDRRVDRIGSSKAVRVDVRIIAATNKNLEQMIAKNEFREDLFYRLNVIEFKIPPLRDRMADIPLLLEYFIDKYNKLLRKNIRGAEPQVLKLLYGHSWPGNIREFENNIEYMVNFEQQQYITLQSVPQRLLKPEGKACRRACDSPVVEDIEGKTLKQLTRDFERNMLKTLTLRRCGSKPSVEQLCDLCDELGISIATYYRKNEK